MASLSPTGSANIPRYQLFIDGKWVDARSGKTFTSPNPSTGGSLAAIAEGDAVDIDIAVRAARKAYEGVWHNVTARDRGRML
ncbi:MAG TPA: aldehyde dehydrogenase family protein, partial [Nitrospiraceae bacterium]